jgi:hypothetical protein
MDPNQNPQGLMQMILTMLAGAGFKNVSKGATDMAQTPGGGAQQLFGLPNMPLFLAGAGLKDAANSMELINPLMKMMMPPPPKEDEVKPPETAAAMQMLSAKLGPGMQGIQVPQGNFPMMR